MGWVDNSTPLSLHPWERPGIQYIGGWVGFRAILERYRISHPNMNSNHGLLSL
jgi:hypothetical protein